jgi:secreted trypsin-like serine protease
MLPVAALAAALTVPSSASAVVGGQDASRPYPNMAELRDGGDFICGASLVAPNKILTAAHCVSENPKAVSGLSFVLGRTTRSDTSSGEEIKAAAVDVHENYDSTTLAYDVAVVTLERNATKGTPIRLATPSERDFWSPGDTATVTGWGTRAGFDLLGLTITDKLQEVQMPIREDAECDRNYTVTLQGGIDEATMICAGELHGTKDSCQGDSGGPIMVTDATGALAQIGTVSWGFGCGYPTQYGVYSRAAGETLYPWISSRIGTSTATGTSAGTTKTTGKKPKSKSRKSRTRR